MTLFDVILEPADRLFHSLNDEEQVRPKPLQCDSFIARSAMQKAIRRGEEKLAIRAAATLMAGGSTGVIWRRLLVTALEDLGVHRANALVSIAAAVEGRRLGFKADDEWPLVARVISSCCKGTRCQAANDLYNLAVHDCCYAAFRAQCAASSPRDLQDIVADLARDLAERLIAALTGLGSDHAPWVLTRRVIEPEILVAAAGQRVSSEARSLYAWAFRKSGLALAIASVLLIDAEGGSPLSPVGLDDMIPGMKTIGDIPSYAMDQYTRVGRAALGDLVRTNEAWTTFAKKLSLTRAVQLSAAGELLFRTEGAAVIQRADWDVSRVLRQRSAVVGCFIAETDVCEGSDLVLSLLPALNVFRQQRLERAL